MKFAYECPCCGFAYWLDDSRVGDGFDCPTCGTDEWEIRRYWSQGDAVDHNTVV